MNEAKDNPTPESNTLEDVRTLIRQVIREYDFSEKERREPAYKAELHEERRRRESLERRVNELVEENQRSRAMAEEAERQSTIRSELQRHGVTKLDLAFRAIKDDIKRASDGRLVGQSSLGEVSLGEYVGQFVEENPEFLPARLAGGTGASAGSKGGAPTAAIQYELDKIRPGMDRAELEKVRDEVARVALQTLGGRKS